MNKRVAASSPFSRIRESPPACSLGIPSPYRGEHPHPTPPLPRIPSAPATLNTVEVPGEELFYIRPLSAKQPHRRTANSRVFLLGIGTRGGGRGLGQDPPHSVLTAAPAQVALACGHKGPAGRSDLHRLPIDEQLSQEPN